jgi:hypothetical protein
MFLRKLKYVFFIKGLAEKLIHIGLAKIRLSASDEPWTLNHESIIKTIPNVHKFKVKVM